MKKIFVFLLIIIFALPGSVFAAAPIVSTGSATSVGTTSATLAGNITDLNGNESSRERGFEYGETTSYGETASETGEFPTGAFTLEINNLSCGTTYYFRAYAEDEKFGDDIGYGSQQTFDTSDCVLPTLGGPSSSEVSQEGASLTAFIVNKPTNTITSRGFEYGVSDSYGQVESETVSLSGSISYVSQFGSSGSGDGQFSELKSVEIDSLGNIYVLDSGNSRVQKFDSDGTYLSQFGSAGTGNGQFQTPYDIAIDSSGNIYVADAENFRVQKFDSNGTYLSQFGSFGTDNGEFILPASVAIDSSGNIYVSDAGVYIDEESRIQKFDSDGTYLSQFGSTGSGDGEFYLPLSLYIDSEDNIYVSDSSPSENRIQKFDSDGAYLSQFGSSGTDDGEFTFPASLVIDSLGYIYVNDTASLGGGDVDRIQKFDSSYDFVLSFGETGSGDGEFSINYDIALDLTGFYLYVVDYGNDRVQKLATGKYSMDITGLTCGTTYHYRAFATTIDGTGYSDDATFTTSDCSEEVEEGQQSTPVVISTGTYVGRKSLPKTPSKVNGAHDEDKKGNNISCTPFTTLMKLGSKQGEVSKLQQTLNTLGFNTGPVDGWFGNLTNTGVKAFQASQSIDADGIVGPVTRGKLNGFCN